MILSNCLDYQSGKVMRLMCRQKLPVVLAVSCQRRLMAYLPCFHYIFFSSKSISIYLSKNMNVINSEKNILKTLTKDYFTNQRVLGSPKALNGKQQNTKQRKKFNFKTVKIIFVFVVKPRSENLTWKIKSLC